MGNMKELMMQYESSSGTKEIVTDRMNFISNSYISGTIPTKNLNSLIKYSKGNRKKRGDSRRSLFNG